MSKKPRTTAQDRAILRSFRCLQCPNPHRLCAGFRNNPQRNLPSCFHCASARPTVDVPVAQLRSGWRALKILKWAWVSQVPSGKFCAVRKFWDDTSARQHLPLQQRDWPKVVAGSAVLRSHPRPRAWTPRQGKKPCKKLPRRTNVQPRLQGPLVQFNENLSRLDLHWKCHEINANRCALGFAGTVVELAIVLGALDQVAHYQAIA